MSGAASAAPATAAALGLLSCHVCGQLSRAASGSHELCCPRCGSPVHVRKPNSIARSWALLIAAMILYVPANLLPMMHTSSLFGSQSDTIMSGVVYFWTSGSWYLALIIFFASIMVPLLKMLALMLLLVSVQRRSRWQRGQRARLYRLVEFVGRWSMLDIYVVAVIVALVQLKALATIQPGAGAIAFGAVVVLTMFAALTFDPRLIWDTREPSHG
jgi:paraquat-inducible protein A